MVAGTSPAFTSGARSRGGALVEGAEGGVGLRHTLSQLMQLFPQGWPFLHWTAPAGVAATKRIVVARIAMPLMSIST
jgi:hypothetical protein